MLDLFPFFSCQEYVSKKDEERKGSNERRLTWPRSGCTAPAHDRSPVRAIASLDGVCGLKCFFFLVAPQRRRDRRLYFVNCRYIDSAEYAYSQQERSSFEFSVYCPWHVVCPYNVYQQEGDVLLFALRISRCLTRVLASGVPNSMTV